MIEILTVAFGVVFLYRGFFALGKSAKATLQEIAARLQWGAGIRHWSELVGATIISLLGIALGGWLLSISTLFHTLTGV